MNGSGPPYPLGAQSSPFNPWTTIISQYANSSVLDAMILSFNAAVDQTQNIDNFYAMIWNIQTAQGYGLDVWGRIVGVTRTIKLPIAPSSEYFGFEEAAGSWVGFSPVDGGSFFGGGAVTSNFNLSDAEFQLLILAKAAGNISDGSIESINNILLNLFPGRGDCYVIDNQNMTMEYFFTFQLTVIEQAIIAQTNVLPRPVGVATSIVISIPPVVPETPPSFILGSAVQGRFAAIYRQFRYNQQGS
jgi:Protein of unknown function (DUF2612)